MIDLHCHILPGIDDGAQDLSVSLAMARALADDGVTVVACTPHILPGLYHNTGPAIRRSIAELQAAIDAEAIPLRLVSGADNHIVPDFVAGLRSGHLLALADSRYVLVEPPHHVAPARIEDLFFSIMVGGYVPILTHPERLAWIKPHYSAIQRLARAGVWMQITAGSLDGTFGRSALYWSERMLGEGMVHILATDAHDLRRRTPVLSRGRDLAARIVGAAEAEHLVLTRPGGVLANVQPSSLPIPAVTVAAPEGAEYAEAASGGATRRSGGGRHHAGPPVRTGMRGFSDRLRRLFE